MIRAALLLLAALAGQTSAGRVPVPPSVEDGHRLLVRKLSPDQVEVLSHAYPGFRVVELCSGHFGGTDRTEAVLGVWKPTESAQWWKRDVHRVGLIWNGTSWDVHVIDDEIEKDAALSRSFPMRWQYTLDGNGFAGRMKCGMESEVTKNLDPLPGDRPFFDLTSEGARNHAVVCFPTDSVYDNWDCLVFSPKDRRFRLWFQKAHAN